MREFNATASGVEFSGLTALAETRPKIDVEVLDLAGQVAVAETGFDAGAERPAGLDGLVDERVADGADLGGDDRVAGVVEHGIAVGIDHGSDGKARPADVAGGLDLADRQAAGDIDNGAGRDDCTEPAAQVPNASSRCSKVPFTGGRGRTRRRPDCK